MIRILPLAFAAGLLAIAGAASAAPAQTMVVTSVFSPKAYLQIHKTTVGLSDIDLSSASGARVALDRIQQAAIAVCGGEPDAASTSEEVENFATCHAEAVRSAARDAKAPVLTALVNAQPRTLMARN